MRALIATEYVTLDGVMEAPGGEQSLGPRGSPMGKGIYDISMSLDGFISGAHAFEMSRIDEIYQAEKWGQDAEAVKRATALAHELDKAVELTGLARMEIR